MELSLFTKELRMLFCEMIPHYIGTAHSQAGDKIIVKTDGTPVGDLDNYALKSIRALIAKHFPNHSTIGEEDQKNKDEMCKILARRDQYQWTIDGLDGTGNRRMGTLSFGAMISLRLGDEILFAAAFRPADENERGNGFFFAERGEGTWVYCEEDATYEQQHTALEGELERITVMLEGSSKKFARLQIAHLMSKITVRAGFSTCVAATAVAQGKASVFVPVENQPWDNWPAWLLIQEAGGIVTDWHGNPPTPANCGSIIAAGNKADHAEILKALTDRDAILKFHQKVLEDFLVVK